MSTEISAPVIEPRSPDQWAAVIVASWATAVDAIVGVGRALIQAKAELPHGDWERMFRDHSKAIPQPIPFSVSTAKRLMLIAEHEVLSNRAHAHGLPPSWMTLYELTKVPDATLREALADGRVHSGMERRDVAALRVPAGASIPGRLERWADPAALTRLRAVLEREAARWPVGERPRLADALRSFAAEIEAAPDGIHHLFHCTTCDRELSKEELVTLRECSREECAGTYWNGDEGRNCPTCNSPFSRVVTPEGCPDCLDEDSVASIEPSPVVMAAGA